MVVVWVMVAVVGDVGVESGSQDDDEDGVGGCGGSGSDVSGDGDGCDGGFCGEDEEERMIDLQI